MLRTCLVDSAFLSFSAAIQLMTPAEEGLNKNTGPELPGFLGCCVAALRRQESRNNWKCLTATCGSHANSSYSE